MSLFFEKIIIVKQKILALALLVGLVLSAIFQFVIVFLQMNLQFVLVMVLAHTLRITAHAKQGILDHNVRFQVVLESPQMTPKLAVEEEVV